MEMSCSCLWSVSESLDKTEKRLECLELSTATIHAATHWRKRRAIDNPSISVNDFYGEVCTDDIGQQIAGNGRFPKVRPWDFFVEY